MFVSIVIFGLSNKVQKDVEVEKYLSESSRSCAKNKALPLNCLKSKNLQFWFALENKMVQFMLEILWIFAFKRNKTKKKGALKKKSANI